MSNTEATKNNGATTGSEEAGMTQSYRGAMGYRSESYDLLVEGRSLKEYPVIIFRHRFLILLLVMFGLGIAGLKNHYSVRDYKSKSMVNIGRYITPQAGETGKVLEQQTNSKEYVKSQIPLLRGYQIAKRVLAINPVVRGYMEAPDTFSSESFPDAQQWISVESGPTGSLNPYSIQNNAELKNEVAQKEDSLNHSSLRRYLDAVTHTQVKDTTLVDIFASASRPDMAAVIANAHGLAFIALVKEQQMNQANVNINFLEERLIEATEKVEQGVAAQLEYAEKYGISTGDTSVINSSFEARFRDLIRNLNEAIFEKVQSESEFRTLQRQGGFGRTTTGNQASQESMRLARLESDYNEQIRAQGSKSVRAKILEERMVAVRGAIKQFGKSQIEDAQTAYRMASRREASLRHEYEKLYTQELQSSEHKVQYDLLTKELLAAETVLADLSRRLEDAIFAADNMQETVQLMDTAVAPSSPEGLNESANLLTGALLGVVIGIFVAFFLDFLDNTIRTVEELESALDLPALGFIPRFSESLISASATAAALAAHGPDGEEGLADLSSMTVPVLVSAPLSAESESFRSLFTAVTHSVPGGEPRVILVTSGQQSDGKSTVATNLAVAFAQAEHSTVLVDIDLRLPAVQTFFPGQDATAGVMNYLAGDEDIHGLLTNSGIDNLKIMFTGGVAHNPTAMLRSDRIVEMIEILASEFEFVIIDSPPVGPVADAQLLSRHVDAVLMVVRSGITPKPVAQSAVQRLRQVSAPIIGAVLNDAKRSDNYRDANYYRMQSGYYSYGYHGYNDKSVRQIVDEASALALGENEGTASAFNETVAVAKDDAITKAVEKAAQKSVRKSSAQGKHARRSARRAFRIPMQMLMVLLSAFLLVAFLSWSHLNRQTAPQLAMFDLSSKVAKPDAPEYKHEVEGEGYFRDLDAEEAAARVSASKKASEDSAAQNGIVAANNPDGMITALGEADKQLEPGWYLQVGSFPKEELAQDFLNFFKDSPFTAQLNRRIIGSTDLFRVLIGPYKHESDARLQIAEVRRRGLAKSSPIVREITSE
jgi:polysaccharide biosynthesis transport protein